MDAGRGAETAAEAAETAPPEGTTAEPHALPPEQLKRFIAAGFLELPPSPLAPPEVHAAIAAKVIGCHPRLNPHANSSHSLRPSLSTSPILPPRRHLHLAAVVGAPFTRCSAAAAPNPRLRLTLTLTLGCGCDLHLTLGDRSVHLLAQPSTLARS